MADLEGAAAPDDALARAGATGFLPDHAQLASAAVAPRNLVAS
jgi:hypothetical protein